MKNNTPHRSCISNPKKVLPIPPCLCMAAGRFFGRAEKDGGVTAGKIARTEAYVNK